MKDYSNLDHTRPHLEEVLPVEVFEKTEADGAVLGVVDVPEMGSVPLQIANEQLDTGDELIIEKSSIEANKGQKVRKWIGRSLIGLAIGSGALTIATDKVGEAKEAVVEAAPWVGAGVLASEGMFIGGAAMMAASAGHKIGNPFTIKKRFPEIVVDAGDSKVFRAGLAINTVGAFGDAAVIFAGTFNAMPVEAWGVAGLAAVDGVGTIAVRKWMVDKYRNAKGDSTVAAATNNGGENSIEKPSKLKSRIRDAEERDLDRLVELDLMMFDKSYGSSKPPVHEVRDMLAKRMKNVADGRGKMIVCEVDGEVSGFGTYFRTNKPWEEFTTWEESTSDGTLEGVTDPEGKYAYVVNMTVAPKGSKVRGMQKIMANLVADGLKNGVEYGYFVSRIPQLTEWLSAQGIDYRSTSEDELDRWAAKYIDTRAISKKGKEEAIDYELRAYERLGFERGKLVKGGFSDEESLSYGVTYKAPVPFSSQPKFVRKMVAFALTTAARSTRIADKL